jgi:hypothetical protein
MMTRAPRNSFQEVMKAKSETVTIAGRIAGRQTWTRNLQARGAVDHGRLPGGRLVNVRLIATVLDGIV